MNSTRSGKDPACCFFIERNHEQEHYPFIEKVELFPFAKHIL